MEKKPKTYYAIGRESRTGRFASLNEVNVRGEGKIKVVNESVYSGALSQADRALGKVVKGGGRKK